MHDLTIRLAEPRDRDVIADFNARLAAETESKALDRQTVRAGVQALLDDPRKGRYFVACDGPRVVAQLMHTFEWSDWRNGDIWWLQSVYVHPDYRRRGLMRRLFERVLHEAETDPHVVGVRLYVEHGNHPAQAVYEHLGLREAGYHVMEKMFNPLPRTRSGS